MQIDHTILLESFEQMYSSVKALAKETLGYTIFNPEHQHCIPKGAGQEAGSTEAQAQATDILYVIRFLQKNT